MFTLRHRGPARRRTSEAIGVLGATPRSVRDNLLHAFTLCAMPVRVERGTRARTHAPCAADRCSTTTHCWHEGDVPSLGRLNKPCRRQVANIYMHGLLKLRFSYGLSIGSLRPPCKHPGVGQDDGLVSNTWRGRHMLLFYLRCVLNVSPSFYFGSVDLFVLLQR